jgi:hypothetical protein
MSKVPGLFVGYRRYAVDRVWIRRNQDRRAQKRQQEFAAWSEQWITVYRLKTYRLWTDAAIRRWLGVPEQQGKYKVFPAKMVLEAEKRPDFQEWRQPRIQKIVDRIPGYIMPLL